MIGTSVSHFKITGKLGEGGMGEVYRATDTKLDREVAIKALPESMSQDPERLARFEREAKVLASLRHPNIAGIYGLEELEGKQFLILELVEGLTLGERIEQGAVPVEEAIRLAHQMATGLEAAHEQGIVHRDFKPDNVKVTPEGEIKILDFGLAKSWGTQSTDSDLTQSPTLTAQMTGQGVILGTAAYMSPEQARGEEADRRADIWSFGVVLFEMLTGQRLFSGKTTSDVLAAVLRAEPNWERLPDDTPAAVRKLLRRCLSRKRKQRLQAIGDARIEFEEVLASPLDGDMAQVVGDQTAPSRGSVLLTWALVAMVVLLLGLLIWNLKQGEVALNPSARLSLRLPSDAPLAPPGSMPLGVGSRSLALSPDGRRLTYVGLVDGQRVLYLREQTSGETQLIPDTDGAYRPFFSPNGEWVGFFANGKLKKIAVSGGTAIDLADTPFGIGGVWAPDGTIFFVSDEGRVVSRVPANGGAVESVNQRLSGTNAISQAVSNVLPGGKHILFTSGQGIGVYSLETETQKILLSSGGGARFLPTGHLLYPDAGKLMVVPFDLDALEISGPAVIALEGLQTGSLGDAQFAVSKNGLLVYVAGESLLTGNFTWLDREGNREQLGLAKGNFGGFSLSPDGSKVAVPIIDGDQTDIWVYDSIRRTPTRFTFDGLAGYGPVWTRDAKRLVYISLQDGVGNFFARDVEGGSEPVQLTKLERKGLAGRMSFDGTVLPIGVHSDETSSRDIHLLPLSDDVLSGDASSDPEPFLQTPFQEMFFAISPDGTRIAYYSNETGNWEVYVQPMNDAESRSGRIRISTDGGEEPIWSADGTELFYRWGNKFYVVDITLGPEFKAGPPRVLFEGPFINVPGWSYDVSPDGLRFLVLVNEAMEDASTELAVVTNFFDHIRRISPPAAN